MHIVVSVLMAAAAAFWAFSRFVDAADDARAVGRRFRWSRKRSPRLIDKLADPREAAAILLVQLAAYEGALTQRQHEAIVNEMRGRFGATRGEAEELFGVARHVLGESGDAANVLGRVLQPIRNNCTPEERADLINMMTAIAALDGPFDHLQDHLIGAVRRALQ